MAVFQYGTFRETGALSDHALTPAIRTRWGPLINETAQVPQGLSIYLKPFFYFLFI